MNVQRPGIRDVGLGFGVQGELFYKLAPCMSDVMKLEESSEVWGYFWGRGLIVYEGCMEDLKELETDLNPKP